MGKFPIEAWKQRQADLRARVRVRPLERLPRFVAGADCAFSADRSRVIAAALVWDRQEDRVVDTAAAVRPCDVPYIPGFLAFREGPAVEEALRGLAHEYGAVLFDAQGHAHPRRCGLATFVSVELGLIGVGVAKSRLVGVHKEPGPERGAWAELTDRGETIGRVVRSRHGVRPIYVSIGNGVDLESAVRLTLACCTRYRLPEPTRRADVEVARLKKRLT